MLFLYRPRQTWMPYRVPRNLTTQRVYNAQLQQKFDSTRRVAPALPAPERDPLDALQQLGELRASGTLTDAEFADLKAKILEPAPEDA